MKSALLISDREDFLRDASSALASIGGEVEPNGAVRFTDWAGRTFAIDEIEPIMRSELTGVALELPDDDVPEIASAYLAFAECKDEALVARICDRIERTIGYRFWVADNNDVVWRASSIDPNRIRLS